MIIIHGVTAQRFSLPHQGQQEISWEQYRIVIIRTNRVNNYSRNFFSQIIDSLPMYLIANFPTQETQTPRELFSNRIYENAYPHLEMHEFRESDIHENVSPLLGKHGFKSSVGDQRTYDKSLTTQVLQKLLKTYDKHLKLLDQMQPSISEELVSINGTQKAMLKATLDFYLDCISEAPVQDALFLFMSISKLIHSDHLSTLEQIQIKNDAREICKKNDLIDEFDFIYKIITHPNPQNRAIGDKTTGMGPEGCRDGQVYFWRNGFGTGALSEPQGLLGLSARNDNTAPHITKEATLLFIETLIIERVKPKILLIKKERRKLKGKVGFSLSSKKIKQKLYDPSSPYCSLRARKLSARSSNK